MNLNKKILASKKNITSKDFYYSRKYPEFFENISKYIYIFIRIGSKIESKQFDVLFY